MASIERNKMNNALKNIVIPYLREQGFKGSFPHFRRMNEKNIDLITFQFNRWGGSFVVELTSCSLEGITTYWGDIFHLTKLLPMMFMFDTDWEQNQKIKTVFGLNLRMQKQK